MVLVLGTSRLCGSDLERLARTLADRIAALPDVNRSVRLTTREDNAAAPNELREVRRLVIDELQTRHIVLSQQPGALPIVIGISEALAGRLLIAQIGTGETPEAIILPIPGGSSTSTPVRRRVSLQKSLVWRQDDPILDFVARPSEILILSPAKISLIQSDDRGWKERYSWDLGGVPPLPRDPRGRLLLARSEFRAYLPGCECRATVESGSQVTCEPSGRGWPVMSDVDSRMTLRLAAGRNYFDQLRTESGTPTLPPFYAAAVLPGQKGPLWALATVEGDTRFYDYRAVETGPAKGWGSNLASATVPDCGNWIVAVIVDETGQESLQVFEWDGDRPVAGSERLEIEGTSTVLWMDEGSRVRLVTRDLKSGRYAAWIVALACAD